MRRRRIISLTAALMALCVLASSCGPRYVRYEEEDKGGAGYMTASWYGPGFHGKPTSSGERFDMHGLTCAHKTLPFGTRLRVTNEKSGRSVDVLVNDRGPFIEGRDLDLSYGAAKEIELISSGTGRVRVEERGRDMRYVKRVSFSGPPSAGLYTIQVGSFADSENAERLRAALELGYNGVYLSTGAVGGTTYYRVRIGKFSSRDDAYRNAKVLADEGYETLITGYAQEM